MTKKIKIVTATLHNREVDILLSEMKNNDLSAGKVIRAAICFYDNHRDCKLEKDK